MRLPLCLFLLCMPAAAQVTRLNPDSRLRPRLTLSLLTVTCTPTAVNMTLVPGGVTAASPTIAITTSWLGVQLISQMNMYGYFTSSTQALAGSSPTSYIASSQVLGQMTTGLPTSYTAFTQTGPFGGAGASLELFTANNFLSLGGSRTDNLTLKIDLTSTPQLPAASYTGVLYLQVQVF